MPTDFYDVLGVSADASSDELKRAYRSRVREYHPDVNDHPEGDAQFKLIRKANDVLTDPAERKDYDRMGHREYVEKRLDDLPPFSVFPEFEDEAPDDSDDSDDEETADERTSARSSSTGTTSSSTGGTATESSNSTRSSQRSRSDSTRQSSASTSTGAGSATSSSGTSGSTRNRSSGTNATDERRNTGSTGSGSTTAGAETSDSSEWADLSADAARRNAEESAGARRRRGLRRWYGVALVALLTYVGGVGAYLLANRGGALTLVGELQTAPIGTLVGPFSLRSPTDYAVTAVDTVVAGTPGPDLLFLAGTVLLPLVVLTAVAQFGQGTAWAYALASLGPAATLLAYPFVRLPVAVLLLGLVVLPLVSGLGFLVDVGRYLLATR